MKFRFFFLAMLLSTINFSIASETAFSKEDPSELTLNMEEFFKIRCDLDSTKQVYYEWHGEMFGEVEGQKQKHIFNVSGMNVARCFFKDGKAILTTREIMLYLDPLSNKIIDTWTNPWTNEEIPVMHVANSPVQNKLPIEMTLKAHKTVSNSYTLMASHPLTYPNPLYGDERFTEHDPKKLYQAHELFQYHFSPNEPTKVSISWSRVSHFLPWMKMGSFDGKLVFHTYGKRVNSYAKLDSTIKEVVETRVPGFKNAPTCILKNKNETSWTYFKKHFDTYLSKSSVFPIDHDLNDDICE